MRCLWKLLETFMFMWKGSSICHTGSCLDAFMNKCSYDLVGFDFWDCQAFLMFLFITRPKYKKLLHVWNMMRSHVGLLTQGLTRALRFQPTNNTALRIRKLCGEDSGKREWTLLHNATWVWMCYLHSPALYLPFLCSVSTLLWELSLKKHAPCQAAN